jgi:hypothetical protein
LNKIKILCQLLGTWKKRYSTLTIACTKLVRNYGAQCFTAYIFSNNRQKLLLLFKKKYGLILSNGRIHSKPESNMNNTSSYLVIQKEPMVKHVLKRGAKKTSNLTGNKQWVFL